MGKNSNNAKSTNGANNDNKRVNKSFAYYMRNLHRVLGFLTLGLTIVYALSGIVLIHRTGDFMRHEVVMTETITPGLDADGVASTLRLRNMGNVTETDTEITFAGGSYNKLTGETTYTKKQLHSPLDKFAALHMMPDKKNPPIGALTTLYGIVLFLLALTSLFMFKPTTRQFKRNMIYTAIGIVIVVVMVLAM